MAEQQHQALPTSATETPTQIENQNTHLPSTTTTNSSLFNGNGRKRQLDHFDLLQTSPYFKMRILASDLRPLFLQVLGAPDFQNCDAAQGIQEKLKLIQDLCREVTVENRTMGKCKSGGERIKETGRPYAKAVGNTMEKPDYNKISGTYIVGKSAFGWNFIMFQGNKPEYYGRTKEEFRAGK